MRIFGTLAIGVVLTLFMSAFSAHAADPVVGSVTTVVNGPVNARTVSVTFTFSDADGDVCHIALFGHDTNSRRLTVCTTSSDDLFTTSESSAQVIDPYVRQVDAIGCPSPGIRAESFRTHHLLENAVPLRHSGC